ncbi:MAG: LpqB family beta-propeller domain-containing protein [Actinomycetota bacterium]
MRRTTTLIVLLVCILALADAHAASAASSAWSSTNGLLAFRSDRDGEPDVFTVDGTGANPVKLTVNSGIADTQPSWSPDGSQIAFVRRRGEKGRPDLYTMTSAGKGRTRLTRTTVPERDPAWSPDGTRVAHAARTSPSGPFRIFVVNPDGTGVDQLTLQGRGIADRSPVWSPDGTRIAFVSDRDGGFPEIYTMNPDGSGVRRLTANVSIDGNPSWSPDGTRILVERCCADGSSDIVSIDVETHAETNLTNSPASMDFDPVWSPDGTKIAFVAFEVGQDNIDVWTMNADGTGPVRITTHPAADLTPDWQPTPTCTIRGTGGPDSLLGTDGNDVICSLDGDDTVTAGLGLDLVIGGKGNDTLLGEDGSDMLLGGAGDDTLDGGPGYDFLDGDNGSDTCLVGPENAFTRSCEVRRRR